MKKYIIITSLALIYSCSKNKESNFIGKWVHEKEKIKPKNIFNKSLGYDTIINYDTITFTHNREKLLLKTIERESPVDVDEEGVINFGNFNEVKVWIDKESDLLIISKLIDFTSIHTEYHKI